jgi:hypothetical protein
MITPESNGPYRVTFNVKFGGIARIGDCEVRFMVDGKRKRKLFNSSQEAVEFCVENGVDRFYVFVPGQKWNCYTIEREGASKMSDQPTNNKSPGPKVVLASLRKEKRNA